MEKDYEFFGIWSQALSAIHQSNREKFIYGTGEYVRGPHYWHIRVTQVYHLHPLILRIIKSDCIRPHDWHQLLLEWPHVSDDNDQMIAYTRNEQAGEAFCTEGSKRMTKTTIGKYLSRHWPHVPDHVRRDWAGRIQPAKYEIWDTIEGIISGVELGPQSCMKSSSGSIPFSTRDNEYLCAWHADESESVHVNWTRHPYIVYQPHYGWRMAVRLDVGKPDIVMGRCLINVTDKTFVRSYTRGEDDYSHSHTDEKLEAWLCDQGFTKNHTWRNKKIGHFDHPDGGVMVPYIDGGAQNASIEGDCLRICNEGELDGTNTNGSGGEVRESLGDCDRCDESVYADDDDRIWAGRDEDTLVCGSCANHFTFARGEDSSTRTGWANYYVRDCNVVTIRGAAYDEDNLPSCIVTLADGTHVHEDDAAWVEEESEYYDPREDDIVCVDGDWYKKDSNTVVQCKDDEYRLRADCWQDFETDDWYADDEDAITINGEMYHPDTLKQWLLDAGQMNLDLEY